MDGIAMSTSEVLDLATEHAQQKKGTTTHLNARLVMPEAVTVMEVALHDNGDDFFRPTEADTKRTSFISRRLLTMMLAESEKAWLVDESETKPWNSSG